MYSVQRSISEQHLQSSSSIKSFKSSSVSTKNESYIKKSQSLGNCSIEKKRGFKPSDRHDPAKKEFLVNLSKQIWQKESSSSGPKQIDLQKLFTPATDAEEILPKNRKLYASSAFYSPTLHPTVEDQVELARRISHSLSDISNQQSKGQSMYVNRKKRSVKWVHEGEGKAEVKDFNGYNEDTKENEYESKTSSYHNEKLPLKLVMNPCGQIRDFSQYQNDFTQTGLLSPDKCAELVTALQAPKGKGAELFAKRRKKAENWIVDETTTAARSPGINQQRPPTSPILPAYSEVGVQRVQLNMHQEQLIQDKYEANKKLNIVKTPWEAALETGSPLNAFEEISSKSQNQYQTNFHSTTPTTEQQQYFPYQSDQKPPLYKNYSKQPAQFSNNQRDLAYKPSIPQGWNAPPPNLPKDLFTPPQIPLDSYAPPSTEKYLPQSNVSYKTNTNLPSYQQQQQQQTISSEYQNKTFPVSKSSYNNSFCSNVDNYQQEQKSSMYSSSYNSNTNKQTNWSSPSNVTVKATSTTFNPSPLSYEKLAKFENTDPDEFNAASMYQYQSPIYRNQQQQKKFTQKPLSNTFQPVQNSSTSTTTIKQSSTIYHSGYQPISTEMSSTSYLSTQGGGSGVDLTNIRGPVSPASSVDLSQFQNYNTAPRGWTEMNDFYRPVKFTQPKHFVQLPYTDF